MRWLRRALDFLAGFPPPEMPNYRPEDYYRRARCVGCGRRERVENGLVVTHWYVPSIPCMGSGRPPAEDKR